MLCKLSAGLLQFFLVVVGCLQLGPEGTQVARETGEGCLVLLGDLRELCHTCMILSFCLQLTKDSKTGGRDTVLPLNCNATTIVLYCVYGYVLYVHTYVQALPVELILLLSEHAQS